MNGTNDGRLHGQGVSSGVRRRRHVRVQRQVTQLSGGSEREISKYQTGKEE
jgi:hypothetical protein